MHLVSDDLTAFGPRVHRNLSERSRDPVAVTFLTIGILLARLTPERPPKTYFVTISVLLTILVGLSRVYLGVHYPSDVLAGWIIRSAWAIFCWAIAIRMQRRGAAAPPGAIQAGPER
jgi:undecaprenyl-diphosphatase